MKIVVCVILVIEIRGESGSDILSGHLFASYKILITIYINILPQNQIITAKITIFC
jgi:hypothetical protein